MEKTLKEKMIYTFHRSNELTLENILDEYISYSEEEIETALHELVESGALIKTDSGQYFLLDDHSMVIGRFLANEKGFGFVKRMNSDLEDIYIDEKQKKDALHQDLVLVKVKKLRSRSDEGKIVHIVERGLKQGVGTFYSDSFGTHVLLDDKRYPFRVFIPSEFHKGASDGHKVVVSIESFLADGNAKGKIIEILGHINDPGVDILSIVASHGIPYEFSDKVMNEANLVPSEASEEEITKRRDLRDEVIVTIDGEDAKDLDDAVHVKRLPNGNYELGVHIADVSYYVSVGSEMDKEAYLRGTSVYLVDRVIPMIPHRLSNGICSLNPKVNRLTLSCIMEYSPKGELVHYDIFESVIKTRERMTYTDVNKLIHKSDNEVMKKYEELQAFFDTMYELSLILRKNRFEHGAIDFDIKEAKIQVDETGKPTEIVERTRGEAERLIEDFMLEANDTVAFHLAKQELPGMYRIHPQPNPAKLHHFANFITSFGYRFTADVEHILPIQLQALLEKIKGTTEEPIISKVLLRSMTQARYSHVNEGHFGLAKEFYTHFTSPIRRYPDLMVHRLIRTFVVNKETPNHDLFPLAEIADHTSNCERRAVEAERETQELKKTEYMKEHIGESFTGVISSITKFGFFVELDNTIEGLVHVSSLKNDHYEFDERTLRLVGKKNKRVFSLGDQVNVKLTKTDLTEHRIYFELTEEKKPSKNPSKGKMSKPNRQSRFDALYKK